MVRLSRFWRFSCRGACGGRAEALAVTSCGTFASNSHSAGRLRCLRWSRWRHWLHCDPIRGRVMMVVEHGSSGLGCVWGRLWEPCPFFFCFCFCLCFFLVVWNFVWFLFGAFGFCRVVVTFSFGAFLFFVVFSFPFAVQQGVGVFSRGARQVVFARTSSSCCVYAGHAG